MKKILFKLFVILSSALLLVILIFFTDSFDELVQMVKSAKLNWLAAGFACMVIYWLLDAVMLHIITVTMHKIQLIMDSIRVTMIGQFFNSIAPFGGAGQPVQAYVMIKDGVKPGHAASIFVVKTVLHQVGIVLYSMLAFVFKGSYFAAYIPEFYYFFILGLLVNTAYLFLSVLLLYKGHIAKKILLFIFSMLFKIKIIKNMDKAERKIESELISFSGGAAILKEDRKSIFILLFTQMLQFTILFAIPYFIQLAVESSRVALTDVLAAQSVIILVSLLIPTPGGTGGVEGLSYLFYGLFFTKGYIIPVILVYRLLTYYPSILFGGLFSVFAPEKPLNRQAQTEQPEQQETEQQEQQQQETKE